MTKAIEWIKGKAELHGWSIYEGDDNEYEFSQYSPAGEDFAFCVSGTTADEIIDGVREYAREFDVDEHVEMWIEARRHGVGGVPSARTLVHDAETLKEWLEDLASVLSQ